MKHTNPLHLAVAGIAAIALASCGQGSSTDTADAAGVDSEGDVVVAHARDRFPSKTASDWVAYADHVVVVTAVAESEVAPTDEELEIGEGYVPRQVTLQTDQVLWSNPAAAQPAPDGTFEWDAWGWEFTGDERTPMAGEDQPRIEVGHTYILAISWKPEISDGGELHPAAWTGLGADSILPYDAGVIGQGELEGSAQESATPLDASDPDFSLEDEMTGLDASALVAALDAA